MTSPLTETNPQSLNELFSRNPMDLSDEDLDRMIAEFRRMREKWQAGETVTKTKKAPASKAVSLGDLGL